MSLTGFQRVGGKVIGGIRSVALRPAAGGAEFVYDRLRERYIGADPPEGFVSYDVIEDSASYTEDVVVIDGGYSVHHRLVFELDGCDPSGAGAAGQLARASAGGFIALVGTAWGQSFLIGYSEEFGDTMPLRLEKSAVTTGSSPADRPSVRITLSSTDASKARPLVTEV